MTIKCKPKKFKKATTAGLLEMHIKKLKIYRFVRKRYEK